MRALGEWSIKNHVTVNMIMVFIIVAGLVTVMKMRREMFPQFALDMIVVSVDYPGSSPEEVEEGICIKIEEQIEGIEGIDRMISTAREGNGEVLVELESGTDVQKVLDEVKAEVDRIDTFPEETENPIINLISQLRSVLDIAITAAERQRLAEINAELASLSQDFRNNLLEETNAFEMLVTDRADLGNLPESLVASAAAEAQRRGHECGECWVFTLQRPSINPFLEYSPNRELRKKIFLGYAMRGNNDNEHDNKNILSRMAALRAERAELMGYETHAHYVLSDNMAENPENVYQLLGKVWEPALEVAAMPPSSYYLVMTHSHALDFDICDRILRRGDARYCGLIGSLSKRRRFEKRYRQQGMSQAVIDTLVCPIGVDGITGKKPAEIAVSVAAEVLRLRDLGVASSAETVASNVHPIGA